MKIKVAIVGAGYWGKNLVRNFYNLGALKIVCDSNDLLEETYKQRYPDIQFSKSFDDVLFDKSIDAVALATPAATHFEMTMEALRAKKHVLVEKPLALKVEEGEKLVSFSRKNGKVLMVGHILQYHNAVLKLKELIDRGELGKIQYLYSNRLNIGKIRSEENILWSFAPHDISVILMLLGELPNTVYATGGNYLQKQVSDVTISTMDFPSGVKAHIFVSWLHPFKEQKLVIVGDKKMAVFDDLASERLEIFPHRIQWVQRTPVATKVQAECVELSIQEPLKTECEHFLDCVTTGCKPKTDGEEGLRVLRILEALQKSIDQNGSNMRINQNSMFDTKHSIDNSLKTDYFVHPSSFIDDNVTIGSGTKIWHFSHVLTGSRIGQNCNIGQNVLIGPDVAIGNDCKIQSNVSIYKGITLGNKVFCGPSMVFTNVYNPRAHIRRMDELRPTLVKEGATLGANCTIICGTTIGRYAFIGAGAVVTKDIPDYALLVGNPAKQKGWMCSCGIKLTFNRKRALCETCNRQYEKLNEQQIKEI